MKRHSDDLYALDAPALGHVVINSATMPIIRSGESIAEARSATDEETRHDVVPWGPDRWRSRHQLGLRYLRLTGDQPTSVSLQASVRPAPRRGVFACSDPELTRLWSLSATTLRLCMQGLMIDGIKRDRMPWAGDQALTTLSNAYAFADKTIAEDSAYAGGELDHGYVNGLSDYSLWWVINQWLLHHYFSSTSEELQARAERVNRFVTDLARHCTATGLFRPPTQDDGFPDSAPGSVFIDWGVQVNVSSDFTALQMLWLWALRSAAGLLRQAGHPAVKRWTLLAEQVRSLLQMEAWDSGSSTWRAYLGTGTETSVYANFLGVLAGALPVGAPTEPIEAVIAQTPVGTPFMSAFALKALGQLGARGPAVDHLQQRWGSVMTSGALTFPEEFQVGSADQYAMYGRPFGRSLCHGWSSGPAFLLPELLLGLKPLSPGWKRFSVDPQCAGLQWAAASVPVGRSANICVIAEAGKTTVDVPSGCELVAADRTWVGPRTATFRFCSQPA